MILDTLLRETFDAERAAINPPDVPALRAAATSRRHRRATALVVVGAALVGVLIGATLLVARSTDHSTVVAGPGAGTGPSPAPNVAVLGRDRLAVGELSPWLAARTGVDDRQLVLSFNPSTPAGCPIATNVSVTTQPDRVEVGLFLVDARDTPGIACPVGPPHVAVDLPEPLAGRTLVDLARPGERREVLDGSQLEVPANIPAGMTLFEERILTNNDRLRGWLQSYSTAGAGSFRIAQGMPRGQVLGAIGLGPAGPGEAPPTLDATQPLRTSMLEIDGRAVTVVVYRVTPDDLPADVALLWDDGEKSYALRSGTPTGSPDLDELAAVVRSMHRG